MGELSISLLTKMCRAGSAGKWEAVFSYAFVGEFLLLLLSPGDALAVFCQKERRYKRTGNSLY